MMVFGLLDLGLGMTINREIAILIVTKNSEEKLINTIYSTERIYLLFTILILIIIETFSPLISKNWLSFSDYSNNQVTRIIMIIGFVVASKWPVSFYNNILSGFQRFDILNIVKVLNLSFIGVGSIIVLKYVSPTLEAFFLWNIIVNCFYVIILKYVTSMRVKSITKLKGKFDRKIINSIKVFSIGVALYTLLGSLFPIISRFILSGIFNLSELGYYSLIITLSLGVMQLVYPITGSFFPAFTSLLKKNNSKEIRKLFIQSFQIILILGFTFCTLFLLYSDQILMLWTNNIMIVTETKKIIIPIFVGTFFYTIRILSNVAYLAKGRVSLLVKFQIFIYLIFIPMLIILTMKYGYEGASYSWLIVNFIGFVLSLIVIKVIFHKESIFELYTEMFYPILLMIISTISFYSLLNQFSYVPDQIIQIIIMTLIIFTTGILSSNILREYFKIIVYNFQKH
jgi:O-antigen/teichoic acid export membrane protein